jgi:hypothetical protein
MMDFFDYKGYNAFDSISRPGGIIVSEILGKSYRCLFDRWVIATHAAARHRIREIGRARHDVSAEVEFGEVVTVRDIVSMGREGLESSYSVGPRTIEVVIDFLGFHGLELP